MSKWLQLGVVGALYDLILVCAALLTVAGGFRQGISTLFISGVVLTASLGYLRRSSEVIKFNVVAVAVVISTFVYGLEFYLTFYSTERSRIVDWVGKGFDLRSNVQVYDDLQREKKSPVLVINPYILIKEGGVPEIDKEKILPLGGISRRTTILCNETGRWAIYDSDEHGFNNPLGLYKADIDLLLIGDSFTHGYCVDQNHTIAANLRKSFPATISIGAGGNGELSRLASLMEYGPLLKPKAVLWIYTENTLIRMWKEFSNPILNNYFKIDGFTQRLYEKQEIIDRTLDQFLTRKVGAEPRGSVVDGFQVLPFLKFSNLRNTLLGMLEVFEAKNSQKSNPGQEIEIARTILVKAKKLTESWGGKFYFVYLGSRPARAVGVHESDHEKMLKLAQDLELNTIDSFPVMENADLLKINSYAGRGHYNAEGYRLFSKVVLDSLPPK